MHYSWCN